MGQRGHAALTHGISEELRDWLGSRFWDYINPVHLSFWSIEHEDVGLGVIELLV